MYCNDNVLLLKIEDIRKTLNELVIDKGAAHFEVLELSHQLDLLIKDFMLKLK